MAYNDGFSNCLQGLTRCANELVVTEYRPLEIYTIPVQYAG
jgi:hypothetical protein